MTAEVFLARAAESLRSAEDDLAGGRYNSCANRCYYSCFNAARAALIRAGVAPRRGIWEHAFGQAEFVGRLINRRKVYPAQLRDVLLQTSALRDVADYGLTHVSRSQAARVLRSTRACFDAVRREGEDS